MLRQLNIGPGTQVLNQSIQCPMGGEVIACPEGETDMEDHVWVRWCDSSVGDDGVTQEYVNDLTLTGRIYVKDEPAPTLPFNSLREQLQLIENTFRLVLVLQSNPNCGATLENGNREIVKLAPKTTKQIESALKMVEDVRAITTKAKMLLFNFADLIEDPEGMLDSLASGKIAKDEDDEDGSHKFTAKVLIEDVRDAKELVSKLL